MSNARALLGDCYPTLIRTLGCVSVFMLAACSGGETNTNPAESTSSPVNVEKTVEIPTVAKDIKVEAKPVSGSKLYKRCASCHLPTGEGIPGAYPPLAGRLAPLASKDAGRDYLILTTLYGVTGKMEIGNIAYSGMMPAQPGMSDVRTAAVLNYVMQEFNGLAAENELAFTEDEIKSVRDEYGRISGRKVFELRESAFEGAAK